MKKYIIAFLIFIFISSLTFATEKIDVKEFTSEVKNYSNEVLPELSNEEWISNVIKRRNEFRWTRYF